MKQFANSDALATTSSHTPHYREGDAFVEEPQEFPAEKAALRWCTSDATAHLLGLGHHLLSLASEVCLSAPLALPREAIILDAQADVCGPALVRVGALCDHVPAKFRLPLALEGAQSLASSSAVSIDDSEQEAAPIERGASSSVGSPYADERHVDGVVGQQFILVRPFITIGHGHVPFRCLDPNVTC